MKILSKDTDDETILETIWFCKILLIFAIGKCTWGQNPAHMPEDKIGEYET